MGAGAYKVIGIFGFWSFFMEIFVAQTLFIRRAPKRTLYPLRLLICVAVAVPLKFFPALKIGFFGVSYIMVVGYAILAGMFCYKTSLLNVVFHTVAAYASQHIAWDVFVMMCDVAGNVPLAINFLLYFASYAIVYLVIFLLFSYRSPDYEIANERIMTVVISALIILVTCLLCDLISLYDEWTYLYRTYAIICCALALAVQFGVFERGNLRREAAKLQQEKAVLDGLLYQEQKQQELSRENIEIINMKCHDLKHQISTLRNMSGEESEARIRDIEKAVMIYGDIAKTGNPALDVVLTEKNLICEKRKIKFTYMVDGESLSFLDPVDISSLFGNALDNAIECVTKERDTDRRIIRLNASVVRGWLRIHFENYCGERVMFENGLPVTSKADKNYHGFGVKSIKFIAEKYGGSLVMEQSGELFSVNVILPSAGKEAA